MSFVTTNGTHFFWFNKNFIYLIYNLLYFNLKINSHYYEDERKKHSVKECTWCNGF